MSENDDMIELKNMIELLISRLQVMLDMVDYTGSACSFTEMAEAVLKREIEKAKIIIKQAQELLNE